MKNSFFPWKQKSPMVFFRYKAAISIEIQKKIYIYDRQGEEKKKKGNEVATQWKMKDLYKSHAIEQWRHTSDLHNPHFYYSYPKEKIPRFSSTTLDRKGSKMQSKAVVTLCPANLNYEITCQPWEISCLSVFCDVLLINKKQQRTEKK